MTGPRFVFPDWPAPAGIGAAATTRLGGVSRAPYDSLNLGPGSGDDPACIAENHSRLRTALDLPSEPAWLRQVHGSRVVHVDEGTVIPANAGIPKRADRTNEALPEADAAWTDRPGVVCAVLAADCLPVLLCTRDGGAVGVVHCGWRGLAAGVLTRTIVAMDRAPQDLMAWLGPAIGPEVYEVGPEVRHAFLERHEATAEAFRPAARWNHFLCDLYAIAHLELDAAGVRSVYGGGFCTFRDAENFFSYRRDGLTGRMATLIWLTGKGE